MNKFSTTCTAFFSQLFLCSLLCLFVVPSAVAQSSGAKSPSTANSLFSGAEGNKYVHTEIILDHDSFNPEHPEVIRAGILFTIEPEWHIYWKFPGESGKPTSITWNLPEGWKTEGLQWPLPKRTLERGDILTLAYSNQVLIYTNLIPPADLQAGSTSKALLSADVSWLVCFDRCIPGKTSLSKELAISTETPVRSDSHFHFEKTKRSVPKTINTISDLNDKGISVFFSKDSPKNSLGKSFETASLYFMLTGQGTSETDSSAAQFFESSPYPLVSSPQISHTKEGNTILLVPLTEIESGVTPAGTLAFEVESTKRFTFDVPEFPFEELLPPPADFPAMDSFRVSEHLTSSYKDYESELRNQKNTNASADHTEMAENQASTFILALLSAFIGGIILNVMPCVLPILSIKLMGIVSAKEKSTKANVKDALWFTSGILSSFLLLAIVAASLQSAGHALGWGFQFQYPGFVFSLIVILFILSLGFFDLYIAEIPFLNKLTKLSNKSPEENSATKHFFDGVLISALSTPCTAPFLGTALVFAFSQSTIALFLIFIAIALGLSLPYLIVVSQPALLKLFPKPGNWMNRIKQLMGFGLLATNIWLLKVLEKSVPGSAFRGIGILLALYVFFWFWSWSKEQKGKTARSLLFLTGLAIPVGSWLYLNPLAKHEVAAGSIAWKDYHESQLSTDAPIFIDFTAEWCITCKYNENFILTKPAVQNRFAELGVVSLKADWTTGSEEITAALEKFGGTGVPHYVYIPKDKDGFKTFPTILTETDLLEIIR